MNKLKKKVFWTIFLILSITVFCLLLIFNIQNYTSKRFNIINSLNMAIKNNNPDNKDKNIPSMPKEDPKINDKVIDENIKYMDTIIYTVLLDSNNNIIDIINHSNNDLQKSDISVITKDILSKENISNQYVGNLYFSKYSYTFLNHNYLIIIDTSKIGQELRYSFILSLVLLVFFEIVIYLISLKITKWIVKPVEESFERQKIFVADASHELKTPLSVIMASSESLEENPQELKWIKNINNESKRMNDLITELLELASSEEKHEKDFQVSNLSKIIELASLTFEGKAIEKNIKIEMDIEEHINISFIESDIRKLMEILLDNAVKHSFKNESIKVVLKRKQKDIELLVSNKGEDIPKGEEEKIFERFYRVDKNRNRKENRYGLGLAIAKNIVTNHNGIISVSSNNGITTFKVLFKK